MARMLLYIKAEGKYLTGVKTMTAENITNRLTLDLRKFIWINTILITTMASAIFLIYMNNPIFSALIILWAYL